MFLNQLKKFILGATAVLVLCHSALAEQSTSKSVVDQSVVAKVTEKMNTLKINVISVTPFPVDGLYEVVTSKGIFYVSKNLQFLIDGNIYDLDNQMANLSEKSFSTLRERKLKAFEKDMIVYKAANEKYIVTVFTDTSCPYCKKLHAEIPDYNKLGITVRYLAFPRAGANSSAAKVMGSIWCADDRNVAMDDVKKGRHIESKTCDNRIKEQYELGVFFGVHGTPSIILQDGSIVGGYVPADRLAQMLAEKFK